MVDGFVSLLRRIQGDRSQEAFASCIGVTQGTISRYYAGKRQPTRDVWARIANLFPEYREEIMSLFLALDDANRQYDMPIGKSAKEHAA